jgi:hypothetical protein
MAVWDEWWGGFYDGLVNRNTGVLASVCEVSSPDGGPTLGDWFTTIGGVGPQDDNTVRVRLSNNADHDIEVRATLCVVGWEQ